MVEVQQTVQTEQHVCAKVNLGLGKQLLIHAFAKQVISTQFSQLQPKHKLANLIVNLNSRLFAWLDNSSIQTTLALHNQVVRLIHHAEHQEATTLQA